MGRALMRTPTVSRGAKTVARSEWEDLPANKKRALVVCTHLRRQRIKCTSQHRLQPITGIHIASLIDPTLFEVTLHHEDWHGPYDTLNNNQPFDIVFLTDSRPISTACANCHFISSAKVRSLWQAAAYAHFFPNLRLNFFMWFALAVWMLSGKSYETSRIAQ